MARLLDALQKYVQAPAAGRGDAAPPQATLVWTIARGSLMLLDVCGLSSFAQLRMTLEHALLLQHSAASAASKHSTAVDAPAARTADAARPAVLALAQFRHSVRSAVAPLSKALRSNDAAQVLPVAQATVGALMGACDDVRDTSVPALGWRIQDGADGPRIHELPLEPSRSP
ncbi:hypothetical protein EON67_00835 [archaeon]|nr:MAG: hypothetical protein EON67_00835 [archaeon]